METERISALFQKDLNTWEQLLERLPENLLFQTTPGIRNSIGHLSQHLIGNLNHFVGATLMQTGYVRQRDAEFSEHALSKAAMIDGFKQLKTLIGDYFVAVTEEELEAKYPLEPFGYSMTCGYMLIHLNNHLAYHLGQISYLERFLMNH